MNRHPTPVQLFSVLIFVSCSSFTEGKTVNQPSITESYGETVEVGNSSSLFNQVPDYLMRMYEAIARSDKEDARGSHPKFPGIVRGFVGSATSMKNGFSFNLTGRTPYSIVRSANVLVWKIPKKMNKSTDPTEDVWVLLYDEASPQPISRVRTNIVEEGYLIFQVLYTYKRWFQNPGSNEGLYLEVESSKPTVRASLSFILDGEVNMRKGPVLVEYAEDVVEFSSFFSYSPVRSQRPDSASSANHTLRRRSASGSETSGCKLTNMVVNFKDLGWKDVIAPIKCDVRRCVGECIFPLTPSDNPTAHAGVQVKVHKIGLQQGVGRPCCVPTKYNSKPLLMAVGRGKFSVVDVKEMVATSCGCL